MTFKSDFCGCLVEPPLPDRCLFPMSTQAPFATGGNDPSRFERDSGAIGSPKMLKGAREAKREMMRPDSSRSTCPWETAPDTAPVASKSIGQEVGVSDADTKSYYAETMAARAAAEKRNKAQGGAAAAMSWGDAEEVEAPKPMEAKKGAAAAMDWGS